MIPFRSRLAAAAALIAALASPGCTRSEGLAPGAPPAPVVAQTEVATEAEVSTPSGPALWKVADEDTTIYLFGTVHALPRDVDWYRGNVAEALSSSSLLVTEIEMTPETAGTMQQLVMQKGMLPLDQSLRGLLDEEQRATYEGALTKLGLPVEAFDRFEPWYAAMMLSLLPVMKEGYSPETGVEKVLAGHASEGIARGALETIEFQLELFDSLPLESQIRFLVETADAVDEIKPMLDKMVAEWLEGDADELARLMNEGLTDPVLADRLLYARNRAWADWVSERLAEPGTIFVAVGAGHLAGEHSVQAALQSRGIVSQRVQ